MVASRGARIATLVGPRRAAEVATDQRAQDRRIEPRPRRRAGAGPHGEGGEEGHLRELDDHEPGDADELVILDSAPGMASAPSAL